MEVVVVSTTGLAEVLDDDELRGEVAEEKADDVERDYRDETGDDAGGDEVGHRRDAHDLEGIDFFGDAHGAELGGEARADGGREAEAGDQRSDLARVEVRRDEAGEGRDADLVEALVALETDFGAGEERQEADDSDRAGDDRQRTRTEADLGDEPDDLFPVRRDRARHPRERAAEERQLLAEVLEHTERPVDDGPQDAQRAGQRAGGGHQMAFCGMTWK